MIHINTHNIRILYIFSLSPSISLYLSKYTYILMYLYYPLIHSVYVNIYIYLSYPLTHSKEEPRQIHTAILCYFLSLHARQTRGLPPPKPLAPAPVVVGVMLPVHGRWQWDRGNIKEIQGPIVKWMANQAPKSPWWLTSRRGRLAASSSSCSRCCCSCLWKP